MKRFHSPSPFDRYESDRRVVLTLTSNLLTLLWIAVVVHLAFTNPSIALVVFLSTMFGAMMTKFTPPRP